MLRGGSSVLGIVNFISFLISIPILGGGIWLASRANSTDCIRFLQWPIIIVGLVLMVISLMGFAGACYRQTWLLRLYLFAMFFVVLALLFFIVFAFAVTDRGDGQVVMNRRFLEYQLSDYSGWLRDRVADPQYWATISACLRDGHACAGMRRFARDSNTGMLVPETPDMFYARNLSPIQVTAALSSPNSLPSFFIFPHKKRFVSSCQPCFPCDLGPKKRGLCFSVTKQERVCSRWMLWRGKIGFCTGSRSQDWILRWFSDLVPSFSPSVLCNLGETKTVDF